MSSRLVLAFIVFVVTSFLLSWFQNLNMVYWGASVSFWLPFTGLAPLLFGWVTYYFATPRTARPTVPSGGSERAKLAARLTGAGLAAGLVWGGFLWTQQMVAEACAPSFIEYYQGYQGGKKDLICQVLDPAGSLPFVQSWVIIGIYLVGVGLVLMTFMLIMRLTRSRHTNNPQNAAVAGKKERTPLTNDERNIRKRYIAYFLLSLAIVIATVVLNMAAKHVIGPVEYTLGYSGPSEQVRPVDYALWVLYPLVITSSLGLLAISRVFRRPKRPAAVGGFFLTLATLGIIVQLIALCYNLVPLLQCSGIYAAYCKPRTSVLTLSLLSLVGAVIAVGLPLITGLFKWPRDMSNPANTSIEITKRVVTTLLAGLATAWLPVVVAFLNPGWGSLLIFSPYVLLALLPLIPLALHKNYAASRMPWKFFVGEIAFYIVWALIGFFFVNGGDTQESVGSLFSRWFGGIFGREYLNQLSGTLMMWSFILAAGLLIFLAIAARKPGNSPAHKAAK